MKTLLRTLLIFIMLIFPLSGYAIEPIEFQADMPIQAGATLGLQDCINIALKRSPAIIHMRHNWQMAKHNVSIAKSAYFPTLSGGVGYNRVYNTSKYMQHTTRTLPSANVRLKEMIWNFGKTNANIRMEKFYKIAAEYDFNNEVINTIYNVKCKYYAVLLAKALVEIEEANVRINERNYQRTKAYFDEGIRSKIDLVNAEVYLSDSKISLVKAETDYKNSIVALNNAMYVAYAPEYKIKSTDTFDFNHNYLPVNLVKITNYKDISNLPEAVYNATLTSEVEKTEVLRDYVFKKYPMTFEESLNYAYENRFDLKSMDATKKAMEQALLYVKREYYPELSAGVGYGYMKNLTSDNGSFDISLDLSSSLNPMQTKHKIDNAKIQVEMVENDINELKQNVYFDIQKTYIEMTAQESQIPLNEVKVRQTLENLALADGRYEVGLGDFIELQDAKVNYNVAQHTYVRTLFNYNVSKASLEKEVALDEITVKLDEDEKVIKENKAENKNDDVKKDEKTSQKDKKARKSWWKWKNNSQGDKNDKG